MKRKLKLTTEFLNKMLISTEQLSIPRFRFFLEQYKR